MPTETRDRTLTYRRADWLGVSPGRTYQQLIHEIHKRLPTTKKRTFDYSGGYVECLDWREDNGILLFHLAQFTPDDQTSLVPDPADVTRADTAPLPPPNQTSFLEGDIMFLIGGDHVIICPSGAREAVISSYMERASEKTGFGSLGSRCKLEPVANLEKIRLIQQEGIKKVHLDTILYEATMAREERKTVKQKLSGAILDSILDLFKNDPRLSEIGEFENISARLEIKYDYRKKESRIGLSRMTAIAAELVEDDEPGFVIETAEGKKITHDQLNIRQTVTLPVEGNSVEREAAWVSLREFYDELRSSGALEQ